MRSSTRSQINLLNYSLVIASNHFYNRFNTYLYFSLFLPQTPVFLGVKNRRKVQIYDHLLFDLLRRHFPLFHVQHSLHQRAPKFVIKIYTNIISIIFASIQFR